MAVETIGRLIGYAYSYSSPSERTQALTNLYFIREVTIFLPELAIVDQHEDYLPMA